MIQDVSFSKHAQVAFYIMPWNILDLHQNSRDHIDLQASPYSIDSDCSNDIALGYGGFATKIFEYVRKNL